MSKGARQHQTYAPWHIMAKTKRAWQRMLSGRRLNLLNPSPTDIEIQDIARGLSFQARWNGQTEGEHPYTVAEHSLLVERLFFHIDSRVAPKWRLAALLHDAPEYVIGDMIGPVKNEIGPEYKELEERLTVAIYQRFGIPAELPERIAKRIKRADKASAWAEAVQIAGFLPDEATSFFGKATRKLTNGIIIKPHPPSEIHRAFSAQCDKLIAML